MKPISAAQTNRASENISVLRAQKIELVDARGVTRARLSTEPGVHLLAQGTTGAQPKLQGGGRARVLEP